MDDLAGFRAIDAYTLADAARAAGTGGVLHSLRPQTATTTFVGRALTARIRHEPHRDIPVRDYGGWKPRERIQPGDVMILDGGGLRLTAMGALAALTLARRGAAAAVVNACVRDVEQMDPALPVFAVDTAIATVAGHGYVTDVGEPLYIEGLRIESGDLVAGCKGGIVVVPWGDRAAVLAAAERIVASDAAVREGILRGEALGPLWERAKAPDRGRG